MMSNTRAVTLCKIFYSLYCEKPKTYLRENGKQALWRGSQTGFFFNDNIVVASKQNLVDEFLGSFVIDQIHEVLSARALASCYITISCFADKTRDSLEATGPFLDLPGAVVKMPTVNICFLYYTIAIARMETVCIFSTLVRKNDLPKK